MKNNKTFSNIQLSTLVAFRFLIGWHLLYEGLTKLFNPGWSAASFLSESQWIMSGIAQWIISNSGVLSVVDFMNTWGLIAIGAGLIVGLFTRTAAISGAILLFIYYLNNAPIIALVRILHEPSCNTCPQGRSSGTKCSKSGSTPRLRFAAKRSARPLANGFPKPLA